MTDLCEPCEGPSLEAGLRDAAPRPGAPPTSKHASPRVSELILWAVATSPKCQGLSLEALKKIVTKAGYDVVRNKTHFLRVLKGLVSKGLLKQMTGAGAFRAGKKKEGEVKKKKKKKVAAKKRKMPGRRKASKRGSSKASPPARQSRKRPAAE